MHGFSWISTVLCSLSLVFRFECVKIKPILYMLFHVRYQLMECDNIIMSGVVITSISKCLSELNSSNINKIT